MILAIIEAFARYMNDKMPYSGSWISRQQRLHERCVCELAKCNGCVSFRLRFRTPSYSPTPKSGRIPKFISRLELQHFLHKAYVETSSLRTEVLHHPYSCLLESGQF